MVAYLLLLSGAMSQEPVQFAVNASVNDRFEYRIDMKVDGGKNGVLSGHMEHAERVVSKAADKTVYSVFFAKVNMSATGEMQGAEQTFKEMEGMVMTMTRSASNKLISAEYKGFSMPADNESAPGDLEWPLTPVKPGEKFASKKSPAGFSIDVTTTFLGVENRDNVPCWAFKNEVKESEFATQTGVDMVYVEVMTGRPWESFGSYKVRNSGYEFDVSYKLKRTKTMVKAAPIIR